MTTGSLYLDSIKAGAIRGWIEERIPASLTGAQAALESGWGTSSLARAPYNNQFGIKASADWTGRVVKMPTKEYLNGAWVAVNADFRAYDDINDSVADHAKFFTSTEWRKTNYAAVIGETDYKKACYAVKAAGYATDPDYASKLINIIEKYKLYEWDKEAQSGTIPTTSDSMGVISDLQPKSKVVGGELSEAGRAFGKKTGVSVIGDSLGVGTEPHLVKLIPNSNYDVKGSRQITHSDSTLNGTIALQNMKNAGNLKQNVVVILGTNRGLTASEIDNFMAICGPERKVLWVETASAVRHNLSANEEMRKAATRHKNAFVLGWYEMVGGLRKEYYGSDDIHMTYMGYFNHAKAITQGIYEMSTGDFDSSVAQTTTMQFEGIKGFKLSEDGKLEYTDQNKVKQVIQTEFRGLSTDGKTNYIYNVSANNAYNPQTGATEADWLEGRFESSDLKGLDLFMAACRDMMNRGEPEATYRVVLSELPKGIEIGAEGTIVDTASNPPRYITARVSEITTSQTNPEYNEVVITNVVEVKPFEKPTTLLIQEKLRKHRDELMKEWRKGEPVTLEIISTGSTIFNNNLAVTQLMARVYQGGYDVTEHFHDFRWERASFNRLDDISYNSVVSQTITGSVLSVQYTDVAGDESRFICRIYDDSGELVGVVSEVITIPSKVAGQSAYEAWLSLGNTGTIEDFINSLRGSDGSDGVQGPPGANGQSTYTHTAWADDENGLNFSVSEAGTRAYVGFCVTDTPDDPTDYTMYDWQYVKGPKGDKGADGIAGKDGVGLKSTAVTYGLSASDTTQPTTWSSQVPTLVKGQYLWTRTIWTYTDNTSETGYSKTYIAKDGNNGTDGIAGKDGVGIVSTTITYGRSTSGTSNTGITWTSTVPSVPAGEYLWTKTVWTYTDSTSETGYSVAKTGDTGPQGPQGPQGLQGLQGTKGDQGIPGTKGANGKSSYTHIAYATGDQGQSFNHNTFPQATYIGVYVSNNQNSSGNWRDYAWTLIKGKDGSQGLPGKPGADGKTPYFHTAYANSADGKKDFSITDSDKKRYIGTYTDFVQADSKDPSKYKWVDMVGSVEIGGRNLIHQTKSFSGWTTYNNFVSTSNVSSGIRVTWNSVGQSAIQNDLTQTLIKGQEYVLKLKVRGTLNNFQIYILSTPTPNWNFLSSTNTLNATEFREIIIPFKYTHLNTSRKIFIGGTSTAIGQWLEIEKESVKLEKGNKPTDWTPAPEDVEDQINTKANAEEIASALMDLQQEIEAAATANELSDFIKEYNKELAVRESEKKDAEKRLTNAQNAVDLITNEMKDKSETWEFLERNIGNTPDGILIGNESTGSYLLINENRISFYSNGSEVAFISQNLMEISRGAFVEEIQISKYKLEGHTKNNHLTFRYVGSK